PRPRARAGGVGGGRGLGARGRARPGSPRGPRARPAQHVPHPVVGSRGGRAVRSGFVTLVGRPNVGTSTLLNQVLGTKVTIVSDKPQTTRTQVRGVLTRPDAQVVFVDTPGIHRPRTALGERLNATAGDAIGDVDVVCLVVEASGAIGKGDRWVADRCPPGSVVVVNKVDLVTPAEVLAQLAAAAELVPDAEVFPVSAATGEGVEALVEHLV